jgi:hypothetical protein
MSGVALRIVAGALLDSLVLAGYLLVPVLLDQAQGLLSAAPTIVTKSTNTWKDVCRATARFVPCCPITG